MSHHGVFPVQLRAFYIVPFSVPIAQIQPDKCPDTIWEITVVNLLRGMVELVAIAWGDLAGAKGIIIFIAYRCSALE